MGLKRRELLLLALAILFGGGGTIVVMLIMPEGEKLFANFTQMGELQEQVNSLDQVNSAIKQSLSGIDVTKKFPKDIQIPAVTPQTKEHVQKQLLSQFIGILDKNHIAVLNLQPVVPTAPLLPPAGSDPASKDKPPGVPALPGVPPATPDPNDPLAAAGGDPNNAVSPSDPTVGGRFQQAIYNFTARGTFDQLSTFFSNIANHKKLMELANVKFENEAGATNAPSAATPGTASTSVPVRTIKLTADIRFYLNPNPDIDIQAATSKAP
ncbi:MAG: hypothetical protein K2X01_00460 [Cyanobacteria bacterium]|nr:hypothetical protein [Cyanobacteriota bacterium]